MSSVVAARGKKKVRYLHQASKLYLGIPLIQNRVPSYSFQVQSEHPLASFSSSASQLQGSTLRKHLHRSDYFSLEGPCAIWFHMYVHSLECEKMRVYNRFAAQHLQTLKLGEKIIYI